MKNTSKETHLKNSDVKIVSNKSHLSYLHAFTVALALSIHSIFEGLALGLEEDSHQVCTHLSVTYNNVFWLHVIIQKIACEKKQIMHDQ